MVPLWFGFCRDHRSAQALNLVQAWRVNFEPIGSVDGHGSQMRRRDGRWTKRSLPFVIPKPNAAEESA